MASYLRKYATGSGADIYINIPKAGSANHAVSADWTPAAGDVKVSIDGGVAANIATLPTAIAMGNSTTWKFVFSNAELTGKIINVTVSDSATKAVDDTGFSIETFGNASAMVVFDLSTATQSVNMTQISGDSTAADNLETAYDDTAGAVPWVGIIDQGTAQSATATTLVLRAAAAFANDTPIGCTLWAYGSTQGYWQVQIVDDYDLATDTATVSGWVVTPSGTITYKMFGSAPGATLTEIGTAVWASATRTLSATADANIVSISGDTAAADAFETMLDGDGGNKLYLSQLNITAAANDHAILALGSGTGSGFFTAGGATNGYGIAATGQGTGAGVIAQGTGATASGITAVGITTGNGISAAGGVDGHGIDAVGGAGGTVATHGIRGTGGSLNGCGLRGVGAPTGAGIGGLGGATEGSGIRGAGQGGNSAGIEGQGQGSNAGVKAIGGATGHGLYAVGGATSGAGLVAEAAAGNSHGFSAVKAGSGLDVDADLPWTAAWDAEVQSEVNDGLVAFFTSAASLVDLIWDEALTGATHNVAASGGRRLRELAASSIWTGTAQAGASNSITLDAGASATNEIYDGNLVVITGGTGSGQSRIIVEYNGTSKVAIIDEAWVTTPDNTSEFQVLAGQQMSITHHGLAQGGAASSITLSANASATDDIYNGQTILIRTSTGTGQSRLITAYNGTTKVATVAPAWQVQPVAASVYAILPTGEVIVESFNTPALAAIQSEATDALNAYDPPTRAEATTDANAILAAVDAVDNFIDTEVAAVLAAVDTEVAAILADTGTDGVVISTATQEAIRDAIFARAFSAAYSSLTFDELTKLFASVLLGKASGLAGTTATYRNLADNADVVVATVDADGNRSAVSRTP